MFTEDSPVDVVKAVTGDQAVPAGRTGKTLKVVNVALCSHHHLTGRYRLSTSTAGSTVSKQPDVVVLAEDHASFAVAGAAVLAQLSVTAGALEALRVPVPLHGEEEEAVCDSTSTSCAGPARSPAPATAHHCHCGRLHPAVHHSNLTAGSCSQSCCMSLKLNVISPLDVAERPENFSAAKTSTRRSVCVETPRAVSDSSSPLFPFTKLSVCRH